MKTASLATATAIGSTSVGKPAVVSLKTASLVLAQIVALIVALMGVTLALGGCDRPDRDRVAAASVDEPSGLSAPRAPAERGPVPPNANTVAPGTNASEVLASQPGLKGESAPGPSDTHAAVQAQEAASQAPDTASADEAKKQVMAAAESSSTASETAGTPTARDTEMNSPRHGTLTGQEEANALPKAGQVNNHSSTALEKDSGR